MLLGIDRMWLMMKTTRGKTQKNLISSTNFEIDLGG